MYKSCFIVLFFFLAFAVQGQEQEIYSKKYTFNETKIEVKQLGKDYPRRYSIEIHHQNIIITKQDSIYDSVVENSWLTDLDNDNNFEIIVLLRSAGSGGYGFLDLYEFLGNELTAYKLPEVNPRLKKVYMGHDKFRITDKHIEHQFPAYNDSDPNCCPTGGNVKVKYKFGNDEISEISYEIIENEQENKSKSNRSKLTIFVVAALGLPSFDSGSKTDCWIQVLVGNTVIGRTKKIQNENSPYFNTKFEFNNYSGQAILIKAYDRDFSKDVLIGEVKIEKPKSGKYPIMRETRDGGMKNIGLIEIEFEKQ